MSNKVKFALFSFLALLSITAFAKGDKIVDIQHWETNRGANVFFVELHELPIVDLQVLFSAGSSYDDKTPGIASMVNSLLDDGAGKRNADTIAEAFDDVGSYYSSYVSRDSAVVSFRSLSDRKYLAPTLSVFSDVLSQAHFPKKEFNRVQRQMLAQLKYYEQLPNKVASNAFYHALYGDQPYGHQTLGTAKSIKALSPKNLRQFYKQFYVTRNANLVIVGDLTRAQAEQLVDQVTSKLPEGSKAMPLSPIQKASNHQTQTISFPSTQTHILIGQVGIASKSPDYFATLVGNHVLGGGVLTSRLMKIIREDHGYAYHAASAFVTMKRRGPFLIQLQTRNTQAKNATELAMKTLNEFIEKGPDPKELELAKKNIVQSFPFRLSSNKSILNNVARIAAYQLPLDYLESYRQKVQAVSLADIKRAFQKIIHADQLVTVTVGKLKS